MPFLSPLSTSSVIQEQTLLLGGFDQALASLENSNAATWIDSAFTIGGSCAAAAAVGVASYATYHWLSNRRNTDETPPPVRRLQVHPAALPSMAIMSLALHAIFVNKNDIGQGLQSFVHSIQHLLSPEATAPVQTGNPVHKDPALIAEARNALEQWKKDGTYSDLNGFILRVEARFKDPPMTPEEEAAFIQNWNGYFETARPLIPSGNITDLNEAFVKFEPFRSKIAEEFPKYEERQRSLPVLFETKKGNCDARNALMYTAFGQTGVTLPPRLVWAVEIFRKHIQPVLRDQKSRMIWDLWIGEMRQENKGDVYHTAYLYYAFLKFQGEEPPVSLEELLIARAVNPDKPPPSEENDKSDWSTPFGLPPSDAYYATPPNAMETEIAAALERSIDDFRNNLQNELWDFDVMDTKATMDTASKRFLVFKNRFQQEHYEALKDEKAKREYLESVAMNSLRRFAAGEGFKKLKDLFSDPYRKLPAASLEDLKKAFDEFRKYNDLVRMNLAVVRLAHGTSEEKQSDGLALYEKWLLQIPELKTFDAEYRGLLESIRQEPSQFFLMMNQMESFESKESVRGMVSYSTLRTGAADYLSSYFAKPDNVGVATDLQEQTAYNPPKKEDMPFYEEIKPAAIDVDIIEWSSEWDVPQDVLPGETPSPPKPALPPQSEIKEPHIKVSKETLTDLVLLFGNWGQAPYGRPIFLERWTSDLAQVFSSIHNDKRDFNFGAGVNRILRNLTPKSLNADQGRQWLEMRLRNPQLAVELPPAVRGTLEDLLRRRGFDFLKGARIYLTRAPRWMDLDDEMEKE